MLAGDVELRPAPHDPWPCPTGGDGGTLVGACGSGFAMVVVVLP